MKTAAAEIAEYLYFLLIAIAILASSAIYWKNLDRVASLQAAAVDDWQTSEATCTYPLFPATPAPPSEFLLTNSTTARTTTAAPRLDGAKAADVVQNDDNDGQYFDLNCADLVSQWKWCAIMGMILGGLCLLQNPWFKVVNCHAGPGRRTTKRLVKSGFKHTPGSNQFSKANPQLGILLYEQISDEKKPKNAAKTCCGCLMGCTILWFALAYIFSLIALPIYLGVTLWLSNAIKTVDTTLSTPVSFLLIILVVHLASFVIILCSIVRQIVIRLQKLREKNTDLAEEELWAELQKQAKIVPAKKEGAAA